MTSSDGVIETGTLRDAVRKAILDADTIWFHVHDEPRPDRWGPLADAALVAVNEWLATKRSERNEALARCAYTEPGWEKCPDHHEPWKQHAQRWLAASDAAVGLGVPTGERATE